MDEFIDRGWRPPKDTGPIDVNVIADNELQQDNETIDIKDEPVDSMLNRKNVENVLKSLFQNAEIFTVEVRTGSGAGSARINVHKKYVGKKASLIIWD